MSCKGKNQDDKVDFKTQRKYTDVANERLELQNKVTSPASGWSDGVISTYHSSTSCWLPNLSVRIIYYSQEDTVFSITSDISVNIQNNTNVPPLFIPVFLSKHVNLYA